MLDDDHDDVEGKTKQAAYYKFYYELDPVRGDGNDDGRGHRVFMNETRADE